VGNAETVPDDVIVTSWGERIVKATLFRRIKFIRQASAPKKEIGVKF
jgi:hypothetical protein